MYALAQSLQALPSQGGIYDQDPELLFEWSIIAEEYSNVEREKQRELERQANRSRGRNPATRNNASGVNFKQVRSVPPVLNK